jgi:hypothetical protein
MHPEEQGGRDRLNFLPTGANDQPFLWDSPPTLDNLVVGHAGALPNGRCWPEPVIPEGTA